jgi:hypothetical protein
MTSFAKFAAPLRLKNVQPLYEGFYMSQPRNTVFKIFSTISISFKIKMANIYKERVEEF